MVSQYGGEILSRMVKIESVMVRRNYIFWRSSVLCLIHYRFGCVGSADGLLKAFICVLDIEIGQCLISNSNTNATHKTSKTGRFPERNRTHVYSFRIGARAPVADICDI